MSRIPCHVATSHVNEMTAPASYVWSRSTAPATVPDRSVAANHNVNGKWHGQIRNAPITQAMPRFSDCSGVGQLVHV